MHKLKYGRVTEVLKHAIPLMKRYGNLFDKICTMENMRLAFSRAIKGKSHYREVKEWKVNTERKLQKLLNELKSHRYRTSKYYVFKLWSGGKEREIYKLPLRDRIVQHAIMNYLEPLFRKSFITDTYSSIKGRGIHKGLSRLKKALKDREGTKYCLKLDIRKFYPSIDQTLMKQRIRSKFKDKDLLMVLDEIIDSSDKGVPIGNYTSQYFANFFLTPMDHWIKEELGVKYYFRYCDDIVILGDSKETLRELFIKIKQYLTDIKLELKPNWQIFPVEARSIDFLGYKTRHNYCLLRNKTKYNFIRKVKKNSNSPKLQTVYGCYWGILYHADCLHLWQKYTGFKNHKETKILFK